MGSFNGFAGELVYPYMLRNADGVFVQHIGQKELLKKKNIDSVILLILILHHLPLEPTMIRLTLYTLGLLISVRDLLTSIE